MRLWVGRVSGEGRDNDFAEKKYARTPSVRACVRACVRVEAGGGGALLSDLIL
jgi:hypothetical protein